MEYQMPKEMQKFINYFKDQDMIDYKDCKIHLMNDKYIK